MGEGPGGGPCGLVPWRRMGLVHRMALSLLRVKGILEGRPGG